MSYNICTDTEINCSNGTISTKTHGEGQTQITQICNRHYEMEVAGTIITLQDIQRNFQIEYHGRGEGLS